METNIIIGQKADIKKMYRKKIKTKAIECISIFLQTTSAHGIPRLYCTDHCYRKIWVIIILVVFGLFSFHFQKLIYNYLDFPLSTEIKFQGAKFIFPDVTFCPLSPFVNDSSFTKHQSHYDEIESYIRKLPFNLSFFTKFTKLVKLAFHTRYLEKPGNLQQSAEKFILYCQYNGKECSHKNFTAVNHRIYYRCFVFSPEEDIEITGPTNGLVVLWHRPIHSVPLFVVTEEDDSILHPESQTTADLLQSDGIHLVVNDKKTFSNHELSMLSTSVTVKYGESLSASLKQLHLNSANTVHKMCVNNPDDLKYTNGLHFSYTREDCIGQKQQELIYKQCNCFSENHFITDKLADEKRTYCHEIDNNNMNQTLRNIECHFRYASQPGNMILDAFIDWKVIQNDSVELKKQRLQICPLECSRNIYNFQTMVVVPLNNFQINSSDLFLNKASSGSINIDNKDIIYIDIHSTEEEINILLEARTYRFYNLLADMGGILGLYIGFSVITVAEVLELLIKLSLLLHKYIFPGEHLLKFKEQLDACKSLS